MASVSTTIDLYDEEGNPIKPFIIGNDMVAYFRKIYARLRATRAPIYLIGDPGTGKTHLGWQLLLAYAQETGCKAHMVQVDDETLRATLFGGTKFKNASTESFLAVCGQALQEGDIVFVDEFTRGNPSIQTSFNKASDNKAMVSVNDILIKGHKNARFVFGSNTKRQGDFELKVSFASRMVVYPVGYPSADTETQIAKNIAKQNIGADLAKTVPEGIARFLTSWARGIREETHNQLPISSRNVASMLEGLALLPFDEQAKLPQEWVFGTAGEPVRRKFAERILFTDKLKDDSDLQHRLVAPAMQFIAGITKEEFIQEVLRCSMYFLDIEGIPDGIMKRWREVMATSIV